jgi:hypothetical protein
MNRRKIMSKNQTPEGDNVAELLKEAENITTQAAQPKSVPTQPTEAPTVVSEEESAYRHNLRVLSDDIRDAALAGDRDRVKELVEKSMELMDEYRPKKDDEEESSVFQDLKTKALAALKNKKLLIGAGVVVALGVVTKIAMSPSTDEQPTEDVPDENDESENDSI